MFNKKKNKEKNENKAETKYQVWLRKGEVWVTRYFDAIVAALVITIFLLGAFFVIHPKYKSIVEKEDYSQEDLEVERNNLKNYVSKLTEYKKAYQNLSDVSINRIENMIPDDDVLENFFARLEYITKRKGVLVKSISIVDLSIEEENSHRASKEKEFENLGKLKIDLSVDGIDYFGVKKLLEEFENNLRLMDVKNIKFDLNTKTAEFTIITYYLKK